MILIVGGDSQIGSALAKKLDAEGEEVAITSRRDKGAWALDLANSPANVLLPKCRVAVLCAGMTRLQDCEERQTLARRINVTHTIELARRLHEAGTSLIFLSTNLVYDGSKPYPMAHDKINPSCAYGRFKAETEERLREMTGGKACILRLTKVLGPTNALLKEWAEKLRKRETVEAFEDVRVAPIGLKATVMAIGRLLQRGAEGTFHFSSKGEPTWREVAGHLAEYLGAGASLVRGVLSGKDRVLHSALGMGAREEEMGLHPSLWREAVEEVV